MRAARLLVVALLATSACGGGRSSARPDAPTSPTEAAGSSAPSTASTTTPSDPAPDTSHPAATATGGDALVLAAGDIASCSSPDDEATAAVINAAPPTATVLALGDSAYSSGTTAEYATCYQPSWGAFRDRTRPTIGNHEVLTASGAPYFAYFGAAAGPAGRGWYSFDLGGWHIIALSSNCEDVGGCGPDSPQERFLRADLAEHAATRCTLAMWHSPRWSSGFHGSDHGMATLWQDLVAAHAEVVLSGHDHNYERFTTMDGDGRPDPQGLRQFVVGTGGVSHYPFPAKPLATSEASDNETFGVLSLALHPGGYDWRFLPVEGQSFTDTGSGTCH